jgi:hypothetical protein
MMQFRGYTDEDIHENGMNDKLSKLKDRIIQ